MVDSIRLNKVSLVKELLRCGMPISPTYVLEAVKAKAKDILTILFDNGWDINTQMGGMEPPILAWEDTISLLKLLAKLVSF
jgi:hypothetical protein